MPANPKLSSEVHPGTKKIRLVVVSVNCIINLNNFDCNFQLIPYNLLFTGHYSTLTSTDTVIMATNE